MKEDFLVAKVQHELRVLQRRLLCKAFRERILIEINDELPIVVIPDQ